MADYNNLNNAYPAPTFDAAMNHPRKTYDIPPSYRFETPKFKDLSEMGMRRDQFPANHQMPNPNKSQVYITPYQHTMKRAGNPERMKEIFGETQVYQATDEFKDLKPHVKEQFQLSTSSSYTGYVPRIKLLDESDPNMGSIQEGYTISSKPQQSKSPPANRIKVYNAILEYFPGFIMTKVAQHGTFGVYKALVECLLCNGIQYIVSIVKDDTTNIGNKQPLSNLAWESFQTRFSDDDSEFRKFRMSAFPYGRSEGDTMLNDIIHLVRETKTSFKYQCDNLPISVSLIKTREDETMAQTGTVLSALNTFQCVLEWTE